MVKRGTTATARKSRKAIPSNHKLKDSNAKPPSTTNSPKPQENGTIRGRLSYQSPVLCSTVRENKITVYFGTVQHEDGPNPIEKIIKSDDEPLVIQTEKCTDMSPHKILLKEESKEVILDPQPKLEAEETLEQVPKQTKIKSKVKRKLNDNQSLNKDSPQNHKLTEYFTVRRSVRKPKNVLLEEKQRHLEEIVLSEREDGLKIHVFPGKGRGIVATRLFRKDEFVVEYSGDLIDLAEAKLREKMYATDQNTGCYMYYFQHKSQSYCVDATAESTRLGRLVNHSRGGNLAPKVIEIKDRPHLLLVARSDILPGEELLYDYGDRSRLSLKHHPWLAL